MHFAKTFRTFALSNNEGYSSHNKLIVTTMSQETNKKYIILEDEKLEDGFGWLYRIQAIKDFGDVKAGDKGGWVSGYHNLSQQGNCWIYDDACACDDSQVYGDAKLKDDASINDNVGVSDNAIIEKNARLCGSVSVEDNALVTDDAFAEGFNLTIGGNAILRKNACVDISHERICGNAVIESSIDDYEECVCEYQ